MLRSLVLLLVFSVELSAQVSRAEYKSFDSKVLGNPIRYGLYLPPSYSNSPAKKYRSKLACNSSAIPVIINARPRQYERLFSGHRSVCAL